MAENTVQVQLSKGDIRSACEHNREFFINFFMAEHLIYPIPDFHIETFDRMVTSEVKKLALALPRGHNKTTLAKLAVVYYLLFHPQRFIIYVSNTSEVAQAACRDIAAHITSDNFVKVFGAIEKIMWREGDGIYVFNLLLPDGSRKKCVLRALGAGTQVRGLNVDNQRPEMAVIDDLEDDENTSTPQLQRKLKLWVYGAFFKAFNRWTYKFVWLGNMLSNTSLLKELCDDPDWNSVRMGCIKSDGNPLWPDLWPIEAIKKDFAEYKKKNLTAKWFAEMMNLPLPEGGSIIDSKDIHYRPGVSPGDIEFGFITIDPAVSVLTAADNTAIVVHGFVDNCWQVVEYVKAKIDPKVTFELTMLLAQKWGVKVIGIESQAYQAVLLFFFDYLLKTMHGDFTTEVVQLKASGRKAERILAWASMLKSGNYSINEGEIAITEQLLNYDPIKRRNDDDLIDACAYGIQMIDEYLGLIMSFVTLQKHPAALSSYASCGL